MKDQETWTRECPECGTELTYTNIRSWKHANKNGSKCRPCYSNTVRDTLKRKHKSGEFVPHKRDKEAEKNKPRPFKRPCPDCGEEIGYTSKKGLRRAIREKTICNRCSTYKYKKTFNDIITEDHIKQMRATKAGFQDWNEYLEKYPEKEMYKREVWRLTYQNPLETLENWNKRGRCGVEGAYQLDHIVSINEGWENEIPPEQIADWDNLRMIPWEDNREKGW